MLHPTPAPPTPFPHPSLAALAPPPQPGRPPDLLNGSRQGCRQSPRRRRHQHGQGLGPRRVDLLVLVQIGALAEVLAGKGARVGPDTVVGALLGGEV